MGKSKDAIWDEVLVALDGAAGQRAVLMGDINCDFQDGNAAEGRAWESGSALCWYRHLLDTYLIQLPLLAHPSAADPPYAWP